MITDTLKNTFLILLIVFVSCSNPTEEELTVIEQFELVTDYKSFNSTLHNKDTLYLGVNLSACLWREHHNILITKSNDSLFVQLTIENVWNDKPKKLERVYFKSESVQGLEAMLNSFIDSSKENRGSSFFILQTPQEDSIIVLRTFGLEQIDQYSLEYKAHMERVYPNVEDLKPFEIVEDVEFLDEPNFETK